MAVQQKEYPEEFVRKVKAEYAERLKHPEYTIMHVWLDFGFDCVGDLLKADAFADIPPGNEEAAARQRRILELYKEWYDLWYEMFRVR